MHDDTCLSDKEVSNMAGTHPGIRDLSIFKAAPKTFINQGEGEINRMMCCDILPNGLELAC